MTRKNKKSSSQLYSFEMDGVGFSSRRATQHRLLYFPLCGPDGKNIKSAITPFLGGDIKIDKFSYLTQPASREDLRFGLRNFFIYRKNKGVVSLADNVVEKNGNLQAGQLWHKVSKIFPDLGISLEAINFVPVTGENAELMQITVKNITKSKLNLTPTFAVPVFARALANKHDHEHVTALLNRTKLLKEGIIVEPSMCFNEEGHKLNSKNYFVLGCGDKLEFSVGSFPTVDAFCGERGTLERPESVYENKTPRPLNGAQLQGQEMVGALRFKDVALKPGQVKNYYIVMGIEASVSCALDVFHKFNSQDKFAKALKHNQEFWHAKTHSIEFKTGNSTVDAWNHWVTLQPILRRIYGCSFLPDHDYGKGGKGWRDIWQDLLSLILIEPEQVRDNLINNFAGVRIDGSNATIVGSLPGEFSADRNMITRVWMDHGVWPFLTLLLYIHQTGDFDILLKEVSYFRDPQLSRTFYKDYSWTPEYGRQLKTRHGQVYFGSILEHVFIQHLVQFFNVGEHNLIRLENADWNDGLDMAFHRGESVAFSSFYAGNMFTLAELLESFSKNKNITELILAKELKILFDSINGSKVNYDNISEKKAVFFDQFCQAVQPELSGEKIAFKIEDIVRDLRKKGQWLFDQIRKQEKVKVGKAGGNVWFNGYYDNRGERVEGKKKDQVWMTLTGQVYPIMSGMATEQEIKEVVNSVDKYLKDKSLGGYRLNSDFGLNHYLDFGRAFGFAYGTKENGAFFSHMNVMYAYALYKRGFVKEGDSVLNSIYKMCMNSETSLIFPGIPEYFDSNGRGMYHYLTGSASWWVLTQLTQVFGVRGEFGYLWLEPKLLKYQFSKELTARVSCFFAGRRLNVEYANLANLDYGQYVIKKVLLNDVPILVHGKNSKFVKIDRDLLQKVPLEHDLQVEVSLGKSS